MKKVDNFVKALKNLKEIQGKEPPYDTITETGMVSLFEICFEQSWKAMKELLEQSGFSDHKIGSPRSIIKQAYQAGMLKDENLWLKALDARNHVAHAYNKAIASAIIRDAQQIFLPMFEALEKEISAHWME